MGYPVKVTLEGAVYEARVEVEEYDSCSYVEFSTTLAYVNNEVVVADSLPDAIVDLLFDEAVNEYRMDDRINDNCIEQGEA